MCIFFLTLDKHNFLCMTYTNHAIYLILMHYSYLQINIFSLTLLTCSLPSPAPIITVKYMSFTLQRDIKCLFMKGNGVSWGPAATEVNWTLATVAEPLQCFVTPDCVSYLHNGSPFVFTSSNAQLRYWLLDNAASNNSDVWFEANGGTDFKKTLSAAAGWPSLPAVGTPLPWLHPGQL